MRPRTATLLTQLVLCCALVSCGGDSTEPAEINPDAGKLRRVASDEEFLALFRQGIRQFATQFATGANSGADTSSGGNQQDDAGPVEDSGGGFSQTYTLEQSVDELDQVKYDGRHLYVAPVRVGGCCIGITINEPFDDSVEPTPADPPATPPDSIRIFATDPASGGAVLQSEISLATDLTVQGMYLREGEMTLVTTDSYYGGYGGAWLSPAVWGGNSTGVSIYDVSDVVAPSPVRQIDIEGSFIDSRRIDEIVYIVTRHSPDMDHIDLYTGDSSLNSAAIDALSLQDIVPRASVGGVDTALFDGADCFVANPELLDDTDYGYPTITSITAINLDDGSLYSTCYDGPAHGVYVSRDALYFTRSVYRDGDETTRVHKFSLGERAIEYRGSGEVTGSLWLSGNRDFRINEHQGLLRLVTTEFVANAGDFIDHRVFVLRESATEAELETIATLPNEERPEPIGKPNEDLYGVRFLGDRAYLVTFERTDPLYVLDLSDPLDPLIAGELVVTGFSDFLHPVSDVLLLGLGRQGNKVKLELFDVSEPATPRSVEALLLGEQNSYSEALYNRHAFTYLATDASADRFTIPLESHGFSPYWTMTSGLELFEVRDKQTPSTSSMVKIGSIHARDDRYYSRHRAVIHDEAVYYVADEEVYSTLWTDPTIQHGPH